MFELNKMLQRIKEEKKKNQLTNKDLSVKTGISLGTLNKILSGVSKDPQVSAIIKIATALNVSADYLIFGSENFKSSLQDQSLDVHHDENTAKAVELFSKLDTLDKGRAIGVMEEMLKSEKYSEKDGLKHA